MPEYSNLIIFWAIFLVAAIYSCVGHGGASGYLALMALLAMPPEITRPTALLLNILVASLAARQFMRAGHFEWRIFWPFALASAPCAYLGGTISLPTTQYKILLGVTLIIAAGRIFWPSGKEEQIRPMPFGSALLLGALIGLLSGMTGIGGGIFLTPVLLIANWTSAKKAAGISALFILVNSCSGLAGNYAQIAKLDPQILLWLIPAGLGGILGSTLASQRLQPMALKKVLSAVLLTAGCKLIFLSR